MKQWFLTSILAMACASPGLAADKKSDDSASSEAGAKLRRGFRWVFDGKSLKGWHKNPERIAHGTGGDWRVEDGAIVGQQDPPGSGNGGILLTDDTFKDVEVVFEVKLDWGCDSGFFLRSNEKGQCLQVMLDYHDNGNIGQIYREGLDGKPFRDYRLEGVYEEKDGAKALKKVEATKMKDQPGAGEPPFKLDEWDKLWKHNDWNRLRVIIAGTPPVIVTWLNGKQMTTYAQPEAFEKELGDRGHLAVQVHAGSNLWPRGAKIRFRNIQVRELTEAQAKRFVERRGATSRPAGK